MSTSQRSRYVFWGALGVTGIVLFIGVPFVLAQSGWTEPSDAPPKGNIEPPINTSATAQIKKGTLTVPTLCLGLAPSKCQSDWPTGGLATMPSLQDVTTKGTSTDKTLQLTNGVQGMQTTGKWTLLGNTASTDGPFIEFWGASNADVNRRGELTLGGSSATGRIKFYNYNGSWQPPLMTITPAGNVGIGTGNTDPQKKLDVVGDMRLTGTLTEGTVPWARLGAFPAACKAGEYVESVGGTLTCKTLPAAVALPSGTNDQTLRNNNGTWVSNGNFLVDQTGTLTQGSVPWGRVKLPTCASGYALGFYTDTGNLDCGAPLTNGLTGSGSTSTIAQFTGTNTLGNSVIIDRTDFPVVGAGTVYIGGYPTGSFTRDLSVSRDLIVSGTMTQGSVPWARLTTFPTACPPGKYVIAVGGKLLCDTPAGSGASLPAGTSGQTLRHNGTAWIADSTLVNNGTSVGINTANPTSARLVISDGVGSTGGVGGIAVAVNGNGNNQIIRGAAAPVQGSDVANKDYVDSKVAAQTTSSPNIVTYTSYGAGTNPARGANAPTCDKAGPGWIELFAGWGPLTGEAAYLDLVGSGLGNNGGSGLSSRMQADYSFNRSFVNQLLGGIQEIMGSTFSLQPSVSVAPTVGGIPIMPSCIDLPIGSKGPMGLGIFLGNHKDYLPGDTGEARQNWTIGAMVASGWHPDSLTTIYNSCRICYKKLP